ncbi:MAG: pyruvate dehydrogenase (acetyl-transferring) E1 component subunit alpha [Chlamydiae bacterium]|nr:pyruvate dehydrogenase (acetyl-transferring) E1 component subunit alpha [Chlamydiota bacterium]
MSCSVTYNFSKGDPEKVFGYLGKDLALEVLDEMLLIRNFEQRGEQAYQAGKVWGFYHAYIGQEAIQTAAVSALGKKGHLWATTYRCHALALLLGMTPKEGMCELYGKANGNAKGRGGSMHMYTENMFGGDGIVGGQWALGAGLAFSLKYKNEKGKIAITFGGDGSIAQGTFHETMNMAMLWKLPLMIVIENNQLGMGTQIHRAFCNLPLGENIAKSYGIKSFTVNGMDFCDCYAVFKEAYEWINKTGEPVIIEAVGYRFKGHSISDAANYRTKEELQKIMEEDPILIYANYLKAKNWISDSELEERKKMKKDEILETMKFADESKFPEITSLEEGVLVE